MRDNQTWVVITPAYGRDYKTAQEARRDFLDNLDFRIQPSGQLCNRRDLLKYSVAETVEIRYNRLQNLTIETLDRG